MRRYSVRFEVTVDLVVQDDDAIERVVHNTDGWRDQLYGFADDEAEAGAVEMLARCLGLEGMRLSQLDGWADLPDEAVQATGTMEMVEWERTG